MAAAVPLAQQGLDPGKVTLIHNGIYKLVITLSAHDTQLKHKYERSAAREGTSKTLAARNHSSCGEETTTGMGSHPQGHQREAA